MELCFFCFVGVGGFGDGDVMWVDSVLVFMMLVVVYVVLFEVVMWVMFFWWCVSLWFVVVLGCCGLVGGRWMGVGLGARFVLC